MSAKKRKRYHVLASSESDSDSDADFSEEEDCSSSSDSGKLSDSEAVELAGAAPRPASINRPRQIACNSGKSTSVERGKKSNTSTHIKKTSLWERANEFKSNSVTVREGKLYCQAGSEILSSKKSIVVNHCKSKKHEKALEAHAKTKLRSQTMAEALKRRDTATHAVGETLPMDLRVWRLRTVRTFLSAGVPLSKVDRLRGLLETNNHHLASCSNLAQLIPVVLEEELRTIKEELGQPGKPAGMRMARELSLIFDGTTRLGEAIAIIA